MVKLTVLVSDEKLQELERLRITLGLPNLEDLCNNAFGLLATVAQERKSGRIIALVDDTNKTWVELPIPCLKQLPPQTPVNTAQ